MSETNSYFIKPGYVENEVVSTMDHLSGKEYWTPARRRNARLFQYHVYQRAGEMAAKNGTKTLIDVGCGIGTKLVPIHERLPELQIWGVDQPSAIEMCNEMYDFGTWLVDDFENPTDVEFPSNPGMILCSDVIEHLLNPDLLLSYLKRLAGPDTLVLLSTPERDRLHGEDCLLCRHEAHIREWNTSELQAYVKSQGFEVQDVTFLPAWRPTLHPMLLARDAMRLLRGQSRHTNQLLVLKTSR